MECWVVRLNVKGVRDKSISGIIISEQIAISNFSNDEETTSNILKALVAEWAVKQQVVLNFLEENCSKQLLQIFEELPETSDAAYLEALLHSHVKTLCSIYTIQDFTYVEKCEVPI